MLDSLPSHLSERTRLRNTITAPSSDGPVVVWLKSSFRLHENPAIEVGRYIAAEHDLPLIIYHGIDERYPPHEVTDQGPSQQSQLYDQGRSISEAVLGPWKIRHPKPH